MPHYYFVVKVSDVVVVEAHSVNVRAIFQTEPARIRGIITDRTTLEKLSAVSVVNIPVGAHVVTLQCVAGVVYLHNLLRYIRRGAHRVIASHTWLHVTPQMRVQYQTPLGLVIAKHHGGVESARVISIAIRKCDSPEYLQILNTNC